MWWMLIRCFVVERREGRTAANRGNRPWDWHVRFACRFDPWRARLWRRVLWRSGGDFHQGDIDRSSSLGGVIAEK